MAHSGESALETVEKDCSKASDAVPTSASEITIIMRTVVSTPGSGGGGVGGVGAGSKSEKVTATKAEQPSNRIEVTTSVRTVFECPAAVAESAVVGTTGEASSAAAISSLLQPVLSKNFIALLKSANDSSFENVLEFKSLLGGGGGGGGGGVSAPPGKQHCASCEHSKHGLSSDSDTTAADLEASVQKKVKTEENQPVVVAHGDDQPGAHFAHRPTSTPIKVRVMGDGAVADEDAEHYRLNLLTPPADASFIDSDFESMEQDQYDTCSSKGSPRRDELTEQRLMLEELGSPPVKIAPEKRTDDNGGPLAKATARKGSSTTKAFFEEALRTPLAIRKHFQRRRNSELPKQPSHGNLLHFFTAKKKSNSLEGGLKSPRAKRSLTTTTTATTSENSSENGSRCTSPALTEDNLRRLSVSFVRRESDSCNRTLVWGENYDYSYECEPSHSDVEEEEDDLDGGTGSDHAPLVGTIGNGRATERRVSTRLVHFEIASPDSSYELQPPIVPSFRIDPPGTTTTTGGLAGLLIGAAAYATATTTASFLKRSASEPVHCKLRSHSCTPLTSDIGESDEEEMEAGGRQGRLHGAEDLPIMCQALVPQRPFTSVHQASVRSLDKIGHFNACLAFH
uniref:Uncharacterized protein n=1 Tax=Anopheles farauti TaxID=69004 RepID=A0A182QRC0_9DIPT